MTDTGMLPVNKVGVRVALVIAAKGWRGSGVSFAKIAQGLAARGHEVQVIVAHERLARAFAKEGISTITVPMPSTALWTACRLRRALLLPPDVLIADGLRELRLATLATIGWRTRLVYRYNLLMRRFPRDLVSRLCWPRVDAVVYQSDAVRRRVRVDTPWLASRTAAVIPNGFDVERFRPDPAAWAEVRRRFGIPPGHLLVATGGKPADLKGHDAAVEALALAARRTPPFSWIVLGDGVRLEPSRALAAAAGLDAHFTGFVRPQVVAEILAAADVVLHPAEWEILSNAVGEAMACGAPIVATATDGTEELVGPHGEAGLIVPVGDVAAMADALAELLTDKARRAAMGAAARARIVDEFPLTRMTSAYDSFVRQLARSPLARAEPTGDISGSRARTRR